MGNSWRLADIEELDFAATSTLLAITAKQQSLSTDTADAQRDVEDNNDSDSEYDEGEDFATSKPSPRWTANARNRLIDKFLDRLAEGLRPREILICQSARCKTCCCHGLEQTIH
jgi:hypothetical protein